MNRFDSVLRSPLLAMTLTVAATAATGCVDPAAPPPDTVDHVVVNQTGPLPATPVAEIQVVGDQVTLASAGWTRTAPGVWANASAAGSTSLVIGAEGHRSAIARAEQDLAALRAAGADGVAIEQQQAYLDGLQTTTARLAAAAPPPPVSCNITFVIGPSSPIIPGFIGEFAGAQLVCTGGTQVFTVQAQACTDFGCGPVSTFTPTIGATPQLFGTATAGTAGFPSCFGQAAVSPPGVAASRTNPCG